MAYRPPEPVDASFGTARFDCGRPALDRWLREHALGDETTGRSRTFVVREHDGLDIAGYYCLRASVVEHTAAAAPHGGDPVTAVLLGRLAVDRRHQRRGLGAGLLTDAVRRTFAGAGAGAGDTTGARLLLAHAVGEEETAFYLRRGFEPSPTDDLHLMLLPQDVAHCS